MINQLKAQSHLWLDHTPGDLSRTKVLATLTAQLDAAQVGTHVCHVIAEMASELGDANQRIHDLDAMIEVARGPRGGLRVGRPLRFIPSRHHQRSPECHQSRAQPNPSR